jgi:transposase-like protein
MNPQTQFCPNLACPARGVVGDGNIRVHSWPERRSRCTRCGRTFGATTGTVFDRRSTDPAAIARVLTLLVHGCPPQAIVPAFGLDERTVAD